MMKLPTLCLLTFMVSLGMGVDSGVHGYGPKFGKIQPVDPVVEVGQPFRFNCTVFCQNFPSNVSCNSSDVFIIHYNSLHQREMVTNTDTIKLMPLTSTVLEYYNPSMQKSNGGIYHCYLNQSHRQDVRNAKWLDTSRISVAYPVKVPKKLNCKSPNWESLECSWNCSLYPQFGPLKVGWNVTYTLDYIDPRPKPVEGDVNACHFLISSQAFQKLADYKFTITGHSRKNVTGTVSVAANAALVIPGPVRRLKAEVTHDSVDLRWENPRNLEPTLLPLLYEIRWSSEYGVSQPVRVKDGCKTCNLTVEGLVPFTWYNFTIRCIPQRIGKYWSNESYLVVLTDTYIPGRNPATVTGGFQLINDENKVILYYQDIPRKYAHGAVGSVEASYSSIKGHSVTTSCYHKRRECHLLDLSLEEAYTVTVEAKTQLGYGPIAPTSRFYLFPIIDGPAPPEDFAAEVYNKTANTTSIYFTWSNESISENASCTIFYRHCSTNMKIGCKGGIKWVTFPANTSSYNLTVEHGALSISDYSFAISVEEGGFSKGMSDWIICLFDYDKGPSQAPELEVMDAEFQEEKSLKLKWSAVPCSKGSGRILYNNIYVMELTDDEQPTGFNVSYVVPGNKRMFKVPNLKLGTKYSISLTAVGRTGSKQGQSIIGTVFPPPDQRFPMAIVGVLVGVAVIILVIAIFCSYRYFRKVMDTPISMHVPVGNGHIASFDYQQDEAEEFVLDPEMDTTDDIHFESECSPILLPQKKCLDTHRQLSRDSGTGSMVSNTTKDSFNLSEAGTDSVNNSLEAVSEEGEDHLQDSGEKRNVNLDDLRVTQLPTSQGYCVVGLASPEKDVLHDIQAYGPGPPANNVITVGMVQFENPRLPKSLGNSEESVEFKPVHSSSRGTSTNSLETITTPSPLPVLQQLQKNYLPDQGYGTDDSSGKAKAKLQFDNDKKLELENNRLKDNPMKKKKDFSSLGSVCSSSSLEESYSKLAMRNMPQDDSAINNNVIMDDKNIRKVSSLGKVTPAVLPVKSVMLGDNDPNSLQGSNQRNAFADSCGNSLADTNSDSNLSFGSEPKASPPSSQSEPEGKLEPQSIFSDQKKTGSYVPRPDTLVGKDGQGFLLNHTDLLDGAISDDDTYSDSISPYSKLGISPDIADMCATGPGSTYMPNNNIQPLAGKNGYVDLPVMNGGPTGHRTSICDNMSDSSSQSDFSVEDCSIDMKALGLNTGGAAVLQLESGQPHSNDFANKMCNGYVRDTDIQSTTCV